VTARAGRVVLALALGCAVLLLVAVDAQRDGTAAGGGAAPAAGSSLPTTSSRRPRVSYRGPRLLHGRTLLRARVRGRGATIAAVTFLLDGEPLGSDTTAPYALDVDASLLPPGRHRLRVESVDRLGARASSRPSTVSVDDDRGAALEASTARGLDRALAALARGHVTVRLAPGRYVVPHLELGGGARLVGSGRATRLVAATGGWSLLTLRGRGVRISDLAIEGRGRIDRGIGVASGSSDVRVQRVRIAGVRRTAVEIWGRHTDVSVQDSVIEGGGASGAGVFALGSDQSRDTSVIRTRITGFRSHGINFAQRAYDRPRAAPRAVALDNRISDIDDPGADAGTHEGGIWSGGVAASIIGNHVHDTGWDGIQTVGSSRRVTVIGNRVERTRVGIYLEHETTDSVFARNQIADVATGINVEWRYDGAGSSDNTFEHNRILRPRETGVFVDVAGDRNRIAGNLVAGGAGPAIVLQGASDNVVVGNRACARGDEPVLRQQSAHHDDGRAAHSLRNRLAANRSLDRCDVP
jgi:hypothetical protein